MSKPETTDWRVPLERLEAMEIQLFPRLPDTQLGHDLRACVLELLLLRKDERDAEIADGIREIASQ
jgi:hypothetical protein